LAAYRGELARVAAALRPLVETVDVRGDGAAAFVFATHQGRGIELSLSGERVWVEFWDGPDSAIRDEVFDSFQLAAEAASRWLVGGLSGPA
jgi:hypothetical protein